MKETRHHKAQELIYELKISEIMSRKLITVSPQTTMREVKNLLRDNRISGTPVVADGALVGIVSIEDLIIAMEQGTLDAPVWQRMTTHLHTVRADESAMQGLNRFAQTQVGRLPVLNQDGSLAGIITPDDVTRGLLKALQQAYREHEIRLYRASHIFEDIASERTSLILRYGVAVRDFDAAGHASSQLKQALLRLGIEPQIVRRIAIASYEAEMNIVIHSSAGGQLAAEITPEWIALSACDEGPGIPDIQQALQPGFSTASDRIREMGFGAGMGLSNIEACTDEMHLDSAPGRGTCLKVVVYLRPGSEGEYETTRDS